MNLSPLIDLKEAEVESFDRFVKARSLSGENIFPTLFIATIEQLIIKKCFNFAFEVFFGILFEISQKLELASIDSSKLAIAEFTCAVQCKRLKLFRELQTKPEFYSMINEIGEYFNMNLDLKTVKSVQNLFSRLKVNILVRSEFLSRDSRRSETTYATLHVLEAGNGLWLMAETEDFMDNEALDEERKEYLAKIEMEKKLEREKLERKMKKNEEKRVLEEKLMKEEEKFRFGFVKVEKHRGKEVRERMETEDLYENPYFWAESQAREEACKRLEEEEVKILDYNKRLRKLDKAQEGLLRGEDGESKAFVRKCEKKVKKIEKTLERCEKEGKRDENRKKGMESKILNVLDKQDKRRIEFGKKEAMNIGEWRKKLERNDGQRSVVDREVKKKEVGVGKVLEREERFSVLLNYLITP